MADNTVEPAPKKKKYLVKFNDAWCSKYKFIRKSRKGEHFALCTICGSDFSIGRGGQNDISKHNATETHKKYVEAETKQRKLIDFTASSATANLDQKVTKAEILFSGFLVEHNLPLATADHTSKLFKSMFPDSKIANKYSCGRTKTSHILTGAVAKDIVSDLKEELSSTRWYGLATDGSSDEDDKYLPILARHIGSKSGLVETSLLDMPDINSGSTAQQMYNSCNEVIENFSLDWDNCVTYSSDNTNSMVGARNSLLQKIKSSQGEQKIFDVGCPCHLAHLCAGKGAKELSVNVEDFIIDIYYHFRRSAKRKQQLRDFMEFNNNEVRKIIKHVSTRWLSLGRCLDRTLKQWDSLESYFLSYFDLDDDPVNRDPHDKPSRETRLVQAFKEPDTKLYAMFIQSVIPIFDSFNTFLQSEEPLIHVLFQSGMRLYRSLLTRFVLPEVIASTDDVLNIDLDDPSILKDYENVFIGLMTKQFARDSDILGTPKYRKFLNEARSFYMKCVKYMQTSMPVFRSKIIKSLTFLLLPERHNATSDELQEIVQRFPKVITNTDALESEFLEYQATPDDELPAYFDNDGKPFRIDYVWNQISKITVAHTGQPRFQHLAHLAKFLLLIPHSNSFCESVFSTIRKICSDGRHNLGKDATLGHASTSVYNATTSIRNNLLGILIPKINIFWKRKLACYEWEPTNKVITTAKSVTYKNLQARRQANDDE